jgi:hypothetical protein
VVPTLSFSGHGPVCAVQPRTTTSNVKTKTIEASLGKIPFIKNLLLSLETFLKDMNCRSLKCDPYLHPLSQFKFIKRLVGNKEATRGNKKAPSQKRCCPKTKL